MRTHHRLVTLPRNGQLNSVNNHVLVNAVQKQVPKPKTLHTGKHP